MIRTVPQMAATAVSILGALALFKLPFGTGLLVAAAWCLITSASGRIAPTARHGFCQHCHR